MSTTTSVDIEVGTPIPTPAPATAPAENDQQVVLAGKHIVEAFISFNYYQLPSILVDHRKTLSG